MINLIAALPAIWQGRVVSRSRYWPNNDRSSRSSGPSFLTLLTSGEDGRMTERLSGAGVRRRLCGEVIWLARIHPVVSANLVENNWHAVIR
jgi:hypothetical protein